MVKLFVADLDGCISNPFESPDWEAFTEIRSLNRESENQDQIPPLTICTGRPLPYVEAMGQMLDVRYPVIFESGGGLYDARTNRLTWSEFFNDQMREKIQQIKEWVQSEIIDQYDGTIPEFAKATDVGLINPNTDAIHEMYQKIHSFVHSNYDQFETHYTDVSINVIMKESNKGVALERLSRLTDIPLSQIAYIGDGTNDIPALQKAGFPFAPLNARDETKQYAEIINNKATNAVVEVYHHLSQHVNADVNAQL
jgi:HAD superfamily hydrolase (TIGR01484 family)